MEQRLIGVILQAISNRETADAGLFMGNMGISLALYLLGKEQHTSQAEEEADRLMSHVIKQVAHTGSLAFDRGLAGIGWAISLLHAKGRLDGNIDEILYNIDAALYRDLNKAGAKSDIGLVGGLTGFLCYLVGRLSNASHRTDTLQHQFLVESVCLVIDRFYELMPGRLPLVSRDVCISALWEIPFIFVCLAQVHRLGIYQDKIKNMLKCWEVHMPGAVPYFNTNKLYLVVALAYMNKELNEPYITRHVDLLLQAIDVKAIEDEIDYRVTNMNEGWPFTVLLLYFADCLFPEKHFIQDSFEQARRKVLMDNRTCFEYQLDSEGVPSGISLSFVNGLCGIAVAYALWPQAFSQ